MSAESGSPTLKEEVPCLSGVPAHWFATFCSLIQNEANVQCLGGFRCTAQSCSRIVDYCPALSIPALSNVCKSIQEFVRGLRRNLVEFWPWFYDCVIYNVLKFFMMDLASNGLSNHAIFHISHSSVFTGNPGFVRFIVQKQDKPWLSSAHMTPMELEEVEIIEVMKHLQDVAGETLRTVTIVGSGFAGPLARHASNYLTNLKVLGLMHLSFMEIEPLLIEQLCAEVKLLLPNLPQPMAYYGSYAFCINAKTSIRFC
ncbi:hypothetical protein F5876DRAFT_71006 [Lentinula aff. lateritia]|uniref:Uncharacterized protein n=1 Tax=Lentinula aff. lateritia TaxID=2804960 RepID=A0ACC1TH18_9AGAR|nr:hypothetical protein F5876DRAFT_71006 [Lentinula aff. lateritia]